MTQIEIETYFWFFENLDDDDPDISNANTIQIIPVFGFKAQLERQVFIQGPNKIGLELRIEKISGARKTLPANIQRKIRVWKIQILHIELVQTPLQQGLRSQYES